MNNRCRKCWTPVGPEDEESSTDAKRSSKLEGGISISRSMSGFKQRKFFFLFEDDSNQCRNHVIELGRKVEEFFDVLTVTDLVVDRKIDGSPKPAKFNTYSRGERAINCSAKRFSPRFSLKTTFQFLQRRVLPTLTERKGTSKKSPGGPRKETSKRQKIKAPFHQS